MFYTWFEYYSLDGRNYFHRWYGNWSCGRMNIDINNMILADENTFHEFDFSI